MVNACYACGKVPLSKDEIGICIKLLGSAKIPFCLDCLADDCGCSVQDLLDKIEEFKAAGCTAFL